MKVFYLFFSVLNHFHKIIRQIVIVYSSLDAWEVILMRWIKYHFVVKTRQDKNNWSSQHCAKMTFGFFSKTKPSTLMACFIQCAVLSHELCEVWLVHVSVTINERWRVYLALLFKEQSCRMKDRLISTKVMYTCTLSLSLGDLSLLCLDAAVSGFGNWTTSM